MESQEVVCPNCSATVPAADINITALVAKCVRCNRVFPVPYSSQAEQADVPCEPPSRPGGIIHETGIGGELYIRRSWFSPVLIFLLFFCIAWDGFLVFWYGMALFGKGNAGAAFWLMVLFPVFHVSVGVSLTYYVLAGFLNKTRILADRQLLTIRHGPLPWRGNRDLEVDQVAEIETDQSHTSNGSLMVSVNARTPENEQVVLLGSLPARQAEYVAYAISEYLDVPWRRLETSKDNVKIPAWLSRYLPEQALSRISKEQLRSIGRD